jgi:hypothetical protein
MASINGYKYTTENEAIAAQKACDTYYGIPASPDHVTQHWVDYNFAELNNPQFWYITFDESLLPILGEPIEFEVIQPNPFNETTNNL